VLLVDSIDEPHRSVAGDYGDLYSALFRGAGADVTLFDARADALPAFGVCDGWMIGGSRQSVGDDLPWLDRLEGWVRDALAARVPLVGICFGHQLIAHCAGGSVARAPSGWSIGAVEYRIADGVFDAPPVGQSYHLVASHRDQVLVAPADAVVFASSEHCPVAGYTIGDHVSCVQGHPEFPASVAASLYRSRIGIIDAEQVAAAIETLDRPTDNLAVARWLVDRVAGIARRSAA